MTGAWQYTDESRTAVVRNMDDGTTESCTVEREDVVEHLDNDGEILEPPAVKPEPLTPIEKLTEVLVAKNIVSRADVEIKASDVKIADTIKGA